MIKPKLLLCADSIILDAQTNSITTVNIFEDITPEGFPVFLPRFSVLTVFERDTDDPDQHTVKLRILLGEQTLFEIDASIDFQGKKRSRHIMVLGGFPLPKPGTLSTRVILYDHEVSRYDIDVNPARAQPEVKQTVSSSNH